jgi:3-deoxy-D-manno-octulosonate cytidylyltransferase
VKQADSVIVATPDKEIADAVGSFGGRAILTRQDHHSGTDRVSEVASMMGKGIYVNVQGDEPLVPSATIEACILPLVDGSAQMASVYDWADTSEATSPNVVKVVTDLFNDALYFSRSSIPYDRNQTGERIKKHIGLYAYTGDLLRKFASWQPTPLEKAEGLEQLRFMENGVRIRMSLGRSGELAVDTPEQAEEVRRILSSRL